jgi:hypothetical protein
VTLRVYPVIALLVFLGYLKGTGFLESIRKAGSALEFP